MSSVTADRADDDSYLDIFQDSYSAVQTHVRTSDGFFVCIHPPSKDISDEQYRPVQFRLLHQAASSTIDSLGAFFPGLQVLAGDLESAIKGHMVYWNLWRKHSGIPESWVWGEKRIEWAGYPGRPEFVESNYYLYKVCC
jgi:mannosidase alpha-like ER degradation enhancer 1